MTFAPKTAKQQGAEHQSNKNAFFSAPFIQRKLTVNEPGDAYEQEADAVADKVMRMSDPSVSQPIGKVSISSLQRKCAACEEDDKMQRKETSNTGGGMSAPPIVSDVLSGSGKPLDKGTQHFMESRMGQDFSNVRIHTDGKAAESAQSVNALAYTSGHNIVFNNGQYQPDTEGGKRLLAHELVHVGQQTPSINRVEKKNSKSISSSPQTVKINNKAPLMISRGEKWDAITGVGPWDAYKASKIADYALAAANKTGLPGLHNGPADAWRHCFWNCEMTKALGREQAETIAMNHELNGSGPKVETSMDLLNNWTGQKCGSSENCDQCCQDKLDSGGLFIILDDKLKVSEKTKRTGGTNKGY